ncbi:MAG: hypothetical protein JST39_18555 [Bacteroidetes bacterium]|nr:hypothetical protein [Bacteroidota bacterium]
MKQLSITKYNRMSIWTASYINRSVRRIAKHIDRSTAFGRLRGVLAKAMTDEEGNKIGIIHGRPHLLGGFEFNSGNEVSQPLMKKMETSLDADNKHVLLKLPGITPEKDIIAPPGACYYRLAAFFVQMDCGRELCYLAITDSSGFLDIKQRAYNTHSWYTQVKFKAASLLITGLSIRFFDVDLQEIGHRRSPSVWLPGTDASIAASLVITQAFTLNLQKR